MHLMKKMKALYHLKKSIPKSKVKVIVRQSQNSKSWLSQGQVADPYGSLQKSWHASLGDTWHIPHATRVLRSQKRKPWNLIPSPALPLITQMYLRISQMSFLTHQNPKDALKMLKTEQNPTFAKTVRTRLLTIVSEHIAIIYHIKIHHIS